MVYMKILEVYMYLLIVVQFQLYVNNMYACKSTKCCLLSPTEDDYNLYKIVGITLSTPLPVTLSTNTPQQQFTVEAIDDEFLEDLEETLSFSISLMSSDLFVEVDSTHGTQELTIIDNER